MKKAVDGIKKAASESISRVGMISRETGSIADEVSAFILAPSRKNFLSATLSMSNSLVQNLSRPFLIGRKEGRGE